METGSRLAEIKAGIFVLAAMAVLIVGLLWITGSDFGGQADSRYGIRMKDSGGVKVGDRVRYAGVDVGRVEDLQLRPGEDMPVRFDVTIHADVPIKMDATAHISSTGLLGAQYLQIDPGTSGANPMPPGGEIIGQSSMSLEQAMGVVEQLAGEAGGLIKRTATILDQVSSEMPVLLDRVESVLSEENAENLGTILADLRSMLDQSGPQISEILAHLDHIAETFDAELHELPVIIEKASVLLDDLQTAMGPEGQNLAGLLVSAEGGMESAGSVLSMINDNRVVLESTLRDLHASAAHLKELSQTLKERPFSLVRIKPQPGRRPGDKPDRGTP